jgi:uncharacterized membrane protein YccF (DUF307 family)
MLRIFGNIIWHIPFLGFVHAILALVLGFLLTLTVVAAPIGIGLMEFGKFLFIPFSRVMVSKSDLNIQRNTLWKAYSTVVMVLYLPFGVLLALLTMIEVALLFLSIIGIPVGLVLAKSLGTYFNPVNKKCVRSAVADELERRKAQAEVDKYLGEAKQTAHSSTSASSVVLRSVWSLNCG